MDEQRVREIAGEPRAWMRRWAFEGKPCPPKVKNDKGRWAWPKESRFHEVTSIKIFDDDVPLYALDDGRSLEQRIQQLEQKK